uniref:Sodium/hydrogen exchanger 7 n=1 Tax=Aegilops tauschii TaxID=37682 RepID=N1QT97_AEGTA
MGIGYGLVEHPLGLVYEQVILCTSWGFLLLLYFYVQMARAAVVGALYLLLRYFGYGLDFKEAIIIIWSGLRGAVSLSLALSVKFVFFTGGIVFLTLILNGSTTQIFVARTWYGQPVSTKLNLFVSPKGVLSLAYYFFLKPLHPATPWGVQASYWAMLDQGQITQATANILMRSVDEAMDLVSSRPLCDWNSLQSSVHFPSDSEIAKIVIDESNAGGEEARKFLEEVRCTFPQRISMCLYGIARLLCVLKTRQVTYAVLTHLSENVQNLRKTGLLEEKEMAHLDDAWQTDLKKLKRNPQLVKMPRVSDLLGTHPLVSILPAAVRAPLLSNTKEKVKVHGAALYMEGSRATGIWIVSIGAVKWRSQRLSSRHSLHPIFSHGSTLGLYEVLTGMSCLCDMITDSLVRCFFIEAEKIDQLRRSDPSVEAFLWQESAAVIAKLLIPPMNRMDSCYAADSYQVEAQARVIIFEVGRLFTEANGQRNQLGGSFSAEALQLSREESTGKEQVIITVDSPNKLPLGDSSSGSSSGVTRGS